MNPSRSLILVFAFVAAAAVQSLAGRSQPAAASVRADGPFDSLHFRSIGPPRCPVGSPTSRCTRRTPPSSMSARRTAESGRPPTTARRSRPRCRIKASCRLATSLSRRVIPIWSGWAPASRTIARARAGATAFTNPQTAEKPTTTWASAPRATSIGSSSIRGTTMSCSSRPPAISGDRAAIGASTRPPMLARPGGRC